MPVSEGEMEHLVTCWLLKVMVLCDLEECNPKNKSQDSGGGRWRGK